MNALLAVELGRWMDRICISGALRSDHWLHRLQMTTWLKDSVAWCQICTVKGTRDRWTKYTGMGTAGSELLQFRVSTYFYMDSRDLIIPLLLGCNWEGIASISKLLVPLYQIFVILQGLVTETTAANLLINTMECFESLRCTCVSWACCKRDAFTALSSDTLIEASRH